MKVVGFTSPYRVVTISVINLTLTVLALLAMLSNQGISERNAAASLLVLRRWRSVYR